jgi:hypothetical protein
MLETVLSSIFLVLWGIGCLYAVRHKPEYDKLREEIELSLKK